MTQGVIVFCIIFGAAMFAIGAWAASEYRRSNHGSISDRLSVSHGCDPAVCDCHKAKPYSPPVIRPLFIAHEPVPFNEWVGLSHDERGVPISNPATFQDFAADGVDYRLTLDTNASTPRPSGSNAADAMPAWGPTA